MKCRLKDKTAPVAGEPCHVTGGCRTVAQRLRPVCTDPHRSQSSASIAAADKKQRSYWSNFSTSNRKYPLSDELRTVVLSRIVGCRSRTTQCNAVVLSWRCRYLIADDDRRGRVCASSVRYGSWWMLRCAAGLPARGLCTLPFCNKLAVHAKVWPRPEH